MGTYHVAAVVNADVPQPGGAPSVVLGADVTILPAVTPTTTPTTPLLPQAAPGTTATAPTTVKALAVTVSGSAGMLVLASLFLGVGACLKVLAARRRRP